MARQPPSNMAEHDALVLSYSHLRNFPREKEALFTLRRVASLVKPIMRARRWVVRELAEFFPDQHNLLGLNVNRGQRILLRLRHAGDANQFLPIEQVIDTMLHELSHIVHGPHDGKFHALWNQLRDEHEGLVMKGYTGEGFLSEGRRLGGGGRQQLPQHEVRRLARAAAEKRRTTQGSGGGGRRLGGATPGPGQDMRRVIADAVQQRNNTLRGCGNANHNEREIQEISETATKNGFRTQAEEDAANEAAIAQALWELVQEDERRKLGAAYVPPSAENPAGNGGWSDVSAVVNSSIARPPLNGYYDPETPHPSVSMAPPPRPPTARPAPPSQTRPSVTETATPAAAATSSSSSSSPSVSSAPAKGWTCSICTLHNPVNYLCCDACGTERSEDVSRQLAQTSAARPTAQRSNASSLMSSSSSLSSRVVASSRGVPTFAAPAGPPTWMCSFCGNVMDQQWWTCATCGKMKDRS